MIAIHMLTFSILYLQTTHIYELKCGSREHTVGFVLLFFFLIHWANLCLWIRFFNLLPFNAIIYVAEFLITILLFFMFQGFCVSLFSFITLFCIM